MIGTIVNMWKIKELRQRLLFTLGLLAVYRIGSFVPTPGIDPAQLHRFAGGAGGGLMNMMDLFTGGNLSNMTIFALGVMPYISASIIIQLMTSVIPTLERLSREGEGGRRKINQYTRYGTIVVCAIQSVMLGKSLYQAQVNLIRNPFVFILVMTIALTAGTTFVMWLGEQITSRGIGNGISLIITAGIVSRLPTAARMMWALYGPNLLGRGFGGAAAETRPMWQAVVLLVMFVLVVAGVIFVIQGQRRIPVQYAKRVASGGRVVGGAATYLPLRVNQAGVIPIIFASSIMIIPDALAKYMPDSWGVVKQAVEWCSHAGDGYVWLYAVAIILFCYFYTAITFNPVQIAEDFKKNGAFVPGIRPGKPTADYLEHTMVRITTAGAIFLAVIAIVPMIVSHRLNIPYIVASFLGGTGLLIVVGVMLDTMQQVEAHLLMHHYDGFMKEGKLRGRY
ncbi:MAG: preprotein translocase subunit SecY [bacterium]|nr:preprotein translocase subunit SecY [bacterium]